MACMHYDGYIKRFANSSLVSDLNPAAEGDFSWVEPGTASGPGGQQEIRLNISLCMIILTMRKKQDRSIVLLILGGKTGRTVPENWIMKKS